jgi:hypothetical protein
VHDDRLEPDRAHEHDVFGEPVGEGGIGHGVAPELHDDGRALELADVRQRLDQDGGPLVG